MIYSCPCVLRPRNSISNVVSTSFAVVTYFDVLSVALIDGSISCASVRPSK